MCFFLPWWIYWTFQSKPFLLLLSYVSKCPVYLLTDWLAKQSRHLPCQPHHCMSSSRADPSSEPIKKVKGMKLHWYSWASWFKTCGVFYRHGQIPRLTSIQGGIHARTTESRSFTRNFTLNASDIMLLVIIISYISQRSFCSHICMHKEKRVSLLVLTMLGKPHRHTFCLSACLRMCSRFFSKHHIFIQSLEMGGGIQGRLDFWFPPQESRSFEAAPEGQNRFLPNEEAIVDRHMHFCASPFLFTEEASFVLCVPRGLMRLSEHTCARRKIPLLSVKLYYLAQGHASQCFWKHSECCYKLSATHKHTKRRHIQHAEAG